MRSSRSSLCRMRSTSCKKLGSQAYSFSTLMPPRISLISLMRESLSFICSTCERVAVACSPLLPGSLPTGACAFLHWREYRSHSGCSPFPHPPPCWVCAAPQPGMPHPASPLFLPNKIQLQPLCQCHGPSQAVSSTPFPGCLRHTVLSFYPPRDLCAWTLPQLDRQPPGSNPGCSTPNYSFDPHLLSAYYVAGHVLDVGQIMMNNSN